MDDLPEEQYWQQGKLLPWMFSSRRQAPSKVRRFLSMWLRLKCMLGCLTLGGSGSTISLGYILLSLGCLGTYYWATATLEVTLLTLLPLYEFLEGFKVVARRATALAVLIFFRSMERQSLGSSMIFLLWRVGLKQVLTRLVVWMWKDLNCGPSMTWKSWGSCAGWGVKKWQILGLRGRMKGDSAGTSGLPWKERLLYLWTDSISESFLSWSVLDQREGGGCGEGLGSWGRVVSGCGGSSGTISDMLIKL